MFSFKIYLKCENRLQLLYGESKSGNVGKWVQGKEDKDSFLCCYLTHVDNVNNTRY